MRTERAGRPRGLRGTVPGSFLLLPDEKAGQGLHGTAASREQQHHRHRRTDHRQCADLMPASHLIVLTKLDDFRPEFVVELLAVSKPDGVCRIEGKNQARNGKGIFRQVIARDRHAWLKPPERFSRSA